MTFSPDVNFRTFTTEHGEFRIQARDRLFGRNAGVGETKLARHFLTSRKSKVLNVGAHVGTVAIPLSHYCAEVVAIEANPDTYMLLGENIASHGRDNIKPLWLAANDKFEEIGFVMSSVNTGGSKRQPAFRDHDFFYDNPKETTVPAAPLDDVVGKYGPFDLVFMDCEGSEYHAMLGMPKILSHAETLIVEFFPRHLARVANVTFEQFLKPLAGFPYLLATRENTLVSGPEEISELLQGYAQENWNEDALVFCKHAGRAKRLWEHQCRQRNR